MKFLQIIKKLYFMYKNDPVKKCNVYKNNGCSHVDGFLCDFPSCNIESTYGFKILKYDDFEKPTPSIVFGGGNIKVTSYLLNYDGFSGVGFREVVIPKEIGSSDNSRIGDIINQDDISFQMMFDNVKSIDVVIDALERAKDCLK